MQLEDQIKEVLSYEATKEAWRTKHSSKEWQAASRLNNEFHNMPLSRACMSCLDDLYFTIHFREKKPSMQQKSQNKKNMEEKKFILKPGKVITSHHFSHPVDQNSSEEDFIKLLRINKKHIDKFSKFPGNWEELVDAKPASKPKAAAPATDQAPDLSKLKTTADMEAFATKHKIDISSASTNKERLALITEAMKPKAAAPELTDDQKAEARYAERSAFLTSEGWDPIDDVVFKKGELTIDKGDVWAVTDEEFKALLPTD